VVEADQVEAAVDLALSSRLVTAEGLEAETTRRGGRGRRGTSTVRRMLSDRGLSGGPTASVLEAETSRLLARWRIAVTGREVKVYEDGRYRIDFLLSPILVVEVDGFAYHWSPEAKRYDEERRNRLRLGGMFVLVYTWRDVHFDERRVAWEILAALDRYAA